MNILAIESSCDETAVAIVRDGREVLTDCIASQVAELVSREMENVAQLRVPLTAEAKFGKSWYEAK